MKIHWEVMDAQPEYELLTVKYYNDAGQEYWKNFNPMLWTREAILCELEGYGPHVAAFFERCASREVNVMESIPEKGDFECEPQKYWLGGEIPDTIIPEEPEIDPFTQRLELSEQEPGDPSHEWKIVQLTEEEQGRFIESLAEGIRWERNQYLLTSDFFNFPDACVANVQEWLDYRQALRDIPEQPGFPKTVVWPDRPEVIKETVE